MALIGARSDTSSGVGVAAANERNKKKEEERKQKKKKDKGKEKDKGGMNNGGGTIVQRRSSNRYNLKPEQKTQDFSSTMASLSAMGERKRKESAASDPGLPSDAGGSKLDSSGANDVQVEEKPGKKTETDDRDSKEVSSGPSATSTQKELFSGSSVTVDTEDGTKVRRADRAVLPGTVTSDGTSVQEVDEATAQAVADDPLTRGDAENISETFEESPEYKPIETFVTEPAARILGNDTPFSASGTPTTLVEDDSDLPTISGGSDAPTEEPDPTEDPTEEPPTNGDGGDSPKDDPTTKPWWTNDPSGGGGGGYGGSLPSPAQSDSSSNSTRLVIAGVGVVGAVGVAWYMGWL